MSTQCLYLFTADRCITLHEVSSVWSGRGGSGIGMMGRRKLWRDGETETNVSTDRAILNPLRHHIEHVVLTRKYVHPAIINIDILSKPCYGNITRKSV